MDYIATAVDSSAGTSSGGKSAAQPTFAGVSSAKSRGGGRRTIRGGGVDSNSAPAATSKATRSRVKKKTQVKYLFIMNM